MPAYDPENFVNRKEELALVRDRVFRLTRGEPLAPHERVVHFVGPSGIGKSCLLEKIYAILTEEPKCVPVLIQLDTLKNKSEPLVEEFLAEAYQKFCDYQELSANTILKKPSGPLKLHSSMIVRAINLSAVDKVPVFLLDEINILQKKDLQDIEEHLLEELLHSNQRVVLITAGRSHPMLNDFALRSSSANTFLLSAFDLNTTCEQLGLKSESAQLAEKIIELGGGIPGNNDKLAQHVVGSPPNIPNELQVVQALLADVKKEIEERFHPILEAICVLPDLLLEDVEPLFRSHPALGEHWNEARIKELFTELQQIQIGPGGLINWDREKKSWVVDEPTRVLFEQELRMRDPELWRKLHCTAYQTYEKWGHEYNSQLYKDKAAYHQQRLQVAGMDCDNLEG